MESQVLVISCDVCLVNCGPDSPLVLQSTLLRSVIQLNFCNPSVLVIYYRLQRSCEGYVFTPVCHSVHGEVYLSACWDIIPRPGTPQSRHPPQPPPPQSRQTATVGDGTHPTGMHSCKEVRYAYEDENVSSNLTPTGTATIDI